MKRSVRFAFGMMSAVLAFGVVAGALAAEEKKPDGAGQKFALSLVDGSRLVCQIKAATIPVVSAVGKLDIPLEKIAKLAFNQKTNTVSVRFKNGDQIQGVAAVESVAIVTAFGDYVVALSNAVEIVDATVTAEPAKPFEDSPEKRNRCINNLRMLDSAKEQWALEFNRSEGTEPDPAGIAQYLKGGRIPTCPAGGTYKLNAIGVNPQCNVPGHQL